VDLWQAECSTISSFSGNCATGTVWRCNCSWEAEVVVSTRRSSSALWGRCAAVVERHISRKVNWTSRVYCMASSVAVSNIWWNMFMESLPRLSKISCKGFKQLWQLSMPTCYGVFERLQCGALPSASKWTEAASSNYCNYEAPMV
jgi:hypothetical protein